MKVIITGATGMVGEGVLFECLENPAIEKVLMINRRTYPLTHPKLQELIVTDFMKLDQHAASLNDYDGCFYCAGISSVGMNEEKYTQITYNTTMSFAKVLAAINPAMVFNFVSGSHTDSSEKGRIMWARVKGKTENALLKLTFKGVYNFRPGLMVPFATQKNVKAIYKPVIKLFAFLFPKPTLTMKQIGKAMVHAVSKGYSKHVLEIADIKTLSAI